MFDARLLISFVAVAQYKHFGKAAAAINATQPGISQHIAKLEQQLGFKLIERTKRSVVLAPAGDTFLTHAKHVLSMMQRMKEEGQQIVRGLLGQVTLGFSSSIIYSQIPQRISSFKKSYANVDLRLKVHGGDLLRDMLSFGDIDIAITTLPMPTASYQSVEIDQQKMGVAVPTGHRLSGRTSVTFAELRDDPFIVVPREQHPSIHDTMIAKCHNMGASLKIVAYETPYLNALARVALGEGVALVAMEYRSERHDSVHILTLEDPDLATTPIYAIKRRDNGKPTTARLLEELAKAD